MVLKSTTHCTTRLVFQIYLVDFVILTFDLQQSGAAEAKRIVLEPFRGRRFGLFLFGQFQLLVDSLGGGERSLVEVYRETDDFDEFNQVDMLRMNGANEWVTHLPHFIQRQAERGGRIGLAQVPQLASGTQADDLAVLVQLSVHFEIAIDADVRSFRFLFIHAIL